MRLLNVVVTLSGVEGPPAQSYLCLRQENPNGIIGAFNGADTVGNGRIVFNIAGNKYWLIIKFVYETQICYVRFLGSHKEYDKIRNIQEI